MLARMLPAGSPSGKHNPGGWLAVHALAAAGQLEALGTLLSSPQGLSQLDCRTDTGATAFQLALHRGEPGAADCLRSAGCDVEAVTPDGKTAAHFAAEGGNPQVVELVAALRLPLDSPQSRYGRRPVHLAAKRGNVEAIASLQRHGCDLLALDGVGRTALHHAAWEGREGAVAYLLDQAPSLSLVVDGQGQAPAEAACPSAPQLLGMEPMHSLHT